LLSNLGSRQSHIAKLSHIAKRCYLKGCNRMSWILPPSGTTLQLSIEKYSTLKLTSFSVGSHAKTFQLQVKAQESNQTHEVDSFSTSCDLFGNIDHNSFSSKTSPQFVLTGSTPYCGKLPKQGMMQNGVAYPLPKQEHHTNVTGGGSWPTPSASEAGIGPLIETLMSKNGDIPNPNERLYNPKTGKHVQITLGRAVQLWPTPRAGKTSGENLESWQKRKDAGKVSTPPLELAVKMWPTPRSSEWKDCGQTGSKSQISMSKKSYLCAVVKDGQQDQTNHNMSGSRQESWPTPNTFSEYKTAATMVLNPDWVETLMGYPIAWTESKHWATQLCPKRRAKRLKL